MTKKDWKIYFTDNAYPYNEKVDRFLRFEAEDCGDYKSSDLIGLEPFEFIADMVITGYYKCNSGFSVDMVPTYLCFPKSAFALKGLAPPRLLQDCKEPEPKEFGRRYHCTTFTMFPSVFFEQMVPYASIYQGKIVRSWYGFTKRGTRTSLKWLKGGCEGWWSYTDGALVFPEEKNA